MVKAPLSASCPLTRTVDKDVDKSVGSARRPHECDVWLESRKNHQQKYKLNQRLARTNRRFWHDPAQLGLTSLEVDDSGLPVSDCHCDRGVESVTIGA
jgi:hypothetical protein